MKPRFGQWPARGGEGLYEAYRQQRLTEAKMDRIVGIILATAGTIFILGFIIYA